MPLLPPPSSPLVSHASHLNEFCRLRDGRLKPAEKKLMAKMKFPAEFSQKVEMAKVSLEVFRPWVTKKVAGYVGFEDDILINMVMAELEAEKVPDPRLIQINCEPIRDPVPP
jgi:hypothetical protein